MSYLNETACRPIVNACEMLTQNIEKHPTSYDLDCCGGFDGSRRTRVGIVICTKTQRFCKMAGLTGHAEVDFGVREMYKNPKLWTTLTDLTGFDGFDGPCG